MSINVNVGDIEKSITDQLEKAVSASLDQELANAVADQVRKRSQLGFGVDDNGKQVKFKPLAESTRQQRRGDIAFFTDSRGNVIPYTPDTPPRLSSKTTPAKSNLTNTGEMLESLTGKVKDNQILVNVEGIRKDGSGLTNKEVKDFVEDQGFQFLGLTNGEKKELIREIKNRVLDNL